MVRVVSLYIYIYIYNEKKKYIYIYNNLKFYIYLPLKKIWNHLEFFFMSIKLNFDP